MTDKIVPVEKGLCNCCLDENVTVYQCPINNCNYYLCTKCINKIKNNIHFNAKCPACRNINSNLSNTQVALNIEEIDIEEIDIDETNTQRPVWLTQQLNLLENNYKPICTTTYFNPIKIYYNTEQPNYKICFKFYYGSYNNMSNIYTISLFDRCVYDVFCGLLLLALIINMLIFFGRTLCWLFVPGTPTYWIPFFNFVLLGILGCFLALIFICIFGIILMIMGVILEMFLISCCIE